MIPTASTSKLTYDDYCLFPEDGNRHEIIDGIHRVSPAPFVRHQRIVSRLFNTLYNFVKTHHLGEVLVAPVDVVLSNHDIIQPDILFISRERNSIITEKNVQGAPDLLIEVLSKSTRRHDEIVKRKLYEQFGVQAYWIVDPELETVKLYRLIDGFYGKPALLNRENNDVLESPLLPGLLCSLDGVFSG